MKLIERNCPTCNTDNLNTLEFSGDLKSYDFNNDSEIFWESIAKKKNFFDYYRCTKCDLLYSRSYLNEDSLKQLYSNMSENMSDVELKNRINTQIKYLSYLNNYNILYGDYFELGPDIGLFLAQILKKYPNKFENFTLNEPNVEVHNKLSEVLFTKSYNISRSINNCSNVKDNSLSLAVAIHVIDHLSNPAYIISEIYNKLKNDGILLIVVHNEKSFLAKILRNKWPAFCIQHPQLYNPKSIKFLIESNNFYVENIYRTVNYFNLFYLINIFFKVFNVNINIDLNKFKLNFGIKLGNIIVIARKLPNK